MLAKVRETVEKYNMLTKGDSVVVGVSGGADSVCLADVLNRLKDEYELDITLVHVNHNIRGDEAKRDENFVRELAKKYGNKIRVFSYPVESIAKDEGITVEEAGRRLRYEAFGIAAGKDGKIAVAHNTNDNCETMFMRFFRGTGIKGLRGIAPVRDNIIRPLLYVSRDEIEAYCKENGLSWCTDCTNSVEQYTRNKIRLSVIPLVQREFNENIVNTLLRTSQLMSEEDDYIERQAQRAYKECETEPHRILADKLLSFDRVLQKRIVRIGFRDFSPDLHDISFSHVENVLSLAEGASGKYAELPHGLRAVREHNTILFCKAADEEAEPDILLERDKKYSFKNISVMLSEQKKAEKCKKMYTVSLDCDKMEGEPVLRFRREGDKIRLPFGTKSLKKLFIDDKIPLSKRNAIPLIAYGSDVVWISGVKTSAYYRAGENSRILYLYVWEDNEND